MITSTTNQKIKDIIKLRDSSSRRETGLFIIEGIKEVSLAINSKIKITNLYVCQDLLDDNKHIVSLAKKKKLNILEVNKKVYEKIAYGSRREGILALAQTPQYKLKDIKLGKSPFIVIAERIEKPGNLGAILRTIDAANIDALIVADPLSDVYNHHVTRSSIGTVCTKPIVLESSINIFKWLKENKINIISADPKGTSTYTKLNLKKPTALVVGNEKKGISNFWRENADILASIPMKGSADSLNVSITTAIFIFEALRQRNL